MSAAGAMTPRQRTVAAIAAATVLNLPFGTIYAFSVFLRPMEAMLGIGRAQMSLVFALATISLTVGMNVAPWLYRRLPAVALVLAAGACSAAGLWLTAAADGFAELLLGYGVMFGLGGGVAFILVQQGVNQTMAMPSGLVNGFIVALYPLGAMIGAPVFGWAIDAWGLRQTLAGLGVTVLLAAAIAGWLMRVARIAMHDASTGGGADADPHWGLFARLFLVFFFAAAAGLMVMSQAAGIVQAYGGRTALALGATTLITGLIAAARTGGGWLVDRFPVPRVAIGAHLWSLAGVLILTLWPGPLVAIPALSMIGMGYGIVSGLTAGAIAQYWHRNAFGLVAGRLYIAWCVAAVSLPVLAGWLFDRTEGYGAAVMIAGAGNVLGMLAAAGLPARRR
ncbi:MFS transporter [Quisquiliibacterium transsilvanicum]|uniref:OFA family oxalate/formate antiporter-like MFS transporter n=1 Tax=Quisquiliibacterium transsilvanicum TaxID=1549638 RepID=A0A7W8HG96_9BURK|nr:MFS transporter [Quisquiliibacterium transsilvanicum]MBB5271383.1 OFA family oxalate/formate antiporter-like MFS transporter [Quisquiliibacterium transsilvanicum]